MKVTFSMSAKVRAQGQTQLRIEGSPAPKGRDVGPAASKGRLCLLTTPLGVLVQGDTHAIWASHQSNKALFDKVFALCLEGKAVSIEVTAHEMVVTAAPSVELVEL